jgi:magnesium transporter
MIRTISTQASLGFRWLDVVSPAREELARLGREEGLSSFAVEDSLDPEHLPRFEGTQEGIFVIARGADPSCTPGSSSVQELTRKIAIFAAPGLLITIRRKEMPYHAPVFERWSGGTRRASDKVPLEPLLELLGASVASFGPPIDQLSDRIDESESTLFERSHPTGRELELLYVARRRASVFKRMLHLSIEVLTRIRGARDLRDPQFQDIRDEAETLLFWSDELLEDIDSLMNIQLSLASFRTNEVMRLLTVLGTFFLPLTFIVGVYGMNFKHMPELEWQYGYLLSLLLMAGLSLGIWLWFRKRGWMK